MHLFKARRSVRLVILMANCLVLSNVVELTQVHWVVIMTVSKFILLIRMLSSHGLRISVSKLCLGRVEGVYAHPLVSKLLLELVLIC